MSFLFGSYDFLNHICSRFDTILPLANLSSVNKFTKNYLSNPALGSKHWLETGQKICGKRYWPDNVDAFFPHGSSKLRNNRSETDAKYVAQLMLCPWRSEPSLIGVDPLRGADSLQISKRVEWMNVDHMSFKCVIAAEIGNGRHLITANTVSHISTGSIATWRAHGRDFTKYDSPPPPASPEEIELLQDLKTRGWRPSALFPGSELHRVMIVNNSLLCVVCCGRLSSTEAYFVSSKTLRVLHTLTGFSGQNIIIKPASIWTLDICSVLTCITPSKDRAIVKNPSPAVESAVWAAYKAGCRGDFESMCSIVDPKTMHGNKHYRSKALFSLMLALKARGPANVSQALKERFMNRRDALFISRWKLDAVDGSRST